MPFRPLLYAFRQWGKARPRVEIDLRDNPANDFAESTGDGNGVSSSSSEEPPMTLPWSDDEVGSETGDSVPVMIEAIVSRSDASCAMMNNAERVGG